jgi:hypothetical protein
MHRARSTGRRSVSKSSLPDRWMPVSTMPRRTPCRTGHRGTRITVQYGMPGIDELVSPAFARSSDCLTLCATRSQNGGQITPIAQSPITVAHSLSRAVAVDDNPRKSAAAAPSVSAQAEQFSLKPSNLELHLRSYRGMNWCKGTTPPRFSLRLRHHLQTNKK